MEFVLSPSSTAVQFCVQRGNACCLHGSPSDPRGNFVGPLRLGKTVVLPRIRNLHDCSRPRVSRKGPVSLLLHQIVGTDPNRSRTLEDFTLVLYSQTHA